METKKKERKQEARRKKNSERRNRSRRRFIGSTLTGRQDVLAAVVDGGWAGQHSSSVSDGTSLDTLRTVAARPPDRITDRRRSAGQAKQRPAVDDVETRAVPQPHPPTPPLSIAILFTSFVFSSEISLDPDWLRCGSKREVPNNSASWNSALEIFKIPC